MFKHQIRIGLPNIKIGFKGRFVESLNWCKFWKGILENISLAIILYGWEILFWHYSKDVTAYNYYIYIKETYIFIYIQK